MTPAKVYKVQIRENILRQMILTDRNIVIGIIIVSGAITWFGGGMAGIPPQIRIFGGAILVALLMFVLTAKIDRQPTYIILRRLIQYAFRKRSIRF